MGKFVIKEKEQYIHFTVFTKRAFNDIKKLNNTLKKFSFYFDEKTKSEETFYDSRDNMLSSAGITLNRCIEGNKGNLIIEKEIKVKKFENAKSIVERMYIHPILPKDSVQDHMFFIIEGITGLFSTSFTIDLEYVIKQAIPKIKFTIERERYRMFGGNGFKGEMCFERLAYHNFETKRKAHTYMLTLKNESGEKYTKDFNELIFELEKYVKELIESPDSKYKIAKRMTREITDEDKLIDAKAIKKEQKGKK